MAELVSADDGPILDTILAATYEIWHDGLTRQAYARYYQAQQKTRWGREHLRRVALVEGGDVLASAKIYTFDAVLDGAAVRVAGLGAVFTQPASRRRGAARELVERVVEREAARGASLALLFSEIGPDYYARLGFEAIATTDRELRVAAPNRYGAPMTMVRVGEERDLADIAQMEHTRADGRRFHLVRDRDLIQFSIARKRLRAGLGPAGAREVQFFIAEEGASAVAYVAIDVQGLAWTLDSAGDRDPSGARVGAMLQALIARDPAARRPTITGWLPSGFVPPQVTVVAERPSAEAMMIRPLTPRGTPSSPLTEADLLYWRGDTF